MKKLRWSYWSILGLAMAVLLTASPAMALTLTDVGVSWSNPQGAAVGTVTYPTTGSGNSTTWQVRWGVPKPPDGYPADQAGLGFDPAFPPSSLPDGTFILGTLWHYNNQINSLNGGLNSVDLTLTPHFDNGQYAEWKYRALIDETHNNFPPGPPGCCDDFITLVALDASPLIFTHDGEEYRWTPLGIDPASLQSPELSNNYAPFWVTTVPNPSPLLLIGLGLVGLAGVSRLSAHRK
ncbi:MAG TPA: choice-of-anchor K domain-containing protein [Methylomirabilota bacterium]|nr:choice-of-anchor K domain-containing protein [Methylomirabilota bacterium]